MFTEILRKKETNVKADSEEIFDSYEDLITELHRFLDRLVNEPKKPCELDVAEIFAEGSRR